MNFKLPFDHDEPEINLVPLIDILLVILIFLAATTSFVRSAHFDVSLPQAGQQSETPDAIQLIITADGRYSINEQILSSTKATSLQAALSQAKARQTTAALLIHADANSAYESVVKAMDAARLVGIQRIHFVTQALP